MPRAEDYLDPDELGVAPRQEAALDFKDACDGCGVPITWVDPCFVCTQDCTWCPDCADGHAMVCPVCSGDLKRRPRRTRRVGR